MIRNVRLIAKSSIEGASKRSPRRWGICAGRHAFMGQSVARRFGQVDDNKIEKSMEENIDFMIERRLAEGNDIRKLKQKLLDDPKNFEAILRLLQVSDGFIVDLQL